MESWLDFSAENIRRGGRIANVSLETGRSGTLGMVRRPRTISISRPKTSSSTGQKLRHSSPPPFRVKSSPLRRQSRGDDSNTAAAKPFTNTERWHMKLHLKQAKNASGNSTWREFHHMFPARSMSVYRRYHHGHPSLDPSSDEEGATSYIGTGDTSDLDDDVESGRSSTRLGMLYTSEEVESMIRHASTLENPRPWKQWEAFAMEHPSRRTAAAWGAKFCSKPSYGTRALKLRRERAESSDYVPETREVTVSPPHSSAQSHICPPDLDVRRLTQSLLMAAPTLKRDRSSSLGLTSSLEKRRRHEEAVDNKVHVDVLPRPSPAVAAISPACETAPVDEKLILMPEKLKPIDLTGEAPDAETNPILDVLEFICLRGPEPSIEEWQEFSYSHPSKSLETWLDFFEANEDSFRAMLNNGPSSSSAPSLQMCSKADKAELIKFLLKEGHSPRAKAWRAFSKEHEQHSLALWLQLRTALSVHLQTFTPL